MFRLAFAIATAAPLALAPLAALAETMEIQGPDGRTILLYDNYTWEYKAPPAQLSEPTMERDELILHPGEYEGEPVIVTGPLVEAMGAYRLTSKNGQNNMVVDVTQIPAPEQNRLKAAFEKAGWTGSVKAQVHGQVQRGNLGYRLMATKVILAE